MKQSIHLAILDDELDIRMLVSNYLSGHGYRVSCLKNGAEMYALMSRDPAALVLLDLGLPGEDGLSIARQLRQQWRCGLVIVTGRGEAVDRVVGLELGADDYITKPFDLREMAARIKAVLRRLHPADFDGASGPAPLSEPSLCFDGWRLDPGARRLIDEAGGEVPLTSGEFDLLQVFARHAGRVLSRDFLLDHTRGRDGGPFDRTIDVQVSRLRRKIEEDPDHPRRIKSVRGAGYLFVPPVTREG
ncbi:DNA-binding response regulator [Rhodoferax koreense]|uniref:DNA-binding response regulator n=1 Tax=Rhodoferax koreensis TaxID=1842727 RepID=A0A1P8K0V8_9BURK|nr:winged helix-turn-helix domain-containing protein [Rhodoferax koreense]APW39639.1 DNA-binding response regulator [Rhodoferax koreense]